MPEDSIVIDADTDVEGGETFFNMVKSKHSFTLAAHRSHSSHGSHQSHRSSTPRPPTPDSSRAGSARTPPRATVTVPPTPPKEAIPSNRNSTSTSTSREFQPESKSELPAESSVVPKGAQPLFREPQPLLNSSESSPPSSILPETSIRTLKPKTLPGNSKKFQDIARKVQAGLTIYGYYSDVIDGLIGPRSKMSISRFQKDYGLLITGTISEELMDSLGIVAE